MRLRRVTVAITSALAVATSICVTATPVAAAAGDPTFSAWTSAEYLGWSVRSMAAHVNSDAFLDLVEGSAYNGFRVQLGNGDGTFQTAYAVVGTYQSEMPAFGYFNGDAFLDVFIRSTNQATSTVMIGDGDGNFLDGPDLAVTPGGPAPVSADFNGDGKADLAVASNGNVKLYHGNGLGAFTLFTTLAITNTDPWITVAPDFNKDGYADLAVSEAGVAGQATILVSTGPSTYGTAQTFPTGPFSGFGVGDLNGDTYLDLAVARDTALRTLTYAPGTGLFTQTTVTTSTGFHGTAIADFSLDGVPDIATTKDGSVRIYINNGGGSYTLSANTYAAMSSILDPADFNNDGKPDLLLENTSYRAHVLTNTTVTAPVMSTHPSPQSVTNGGMATLTAAATGSPTVQWQKLTTTSGAVFTDISGAASASYTTPAVELSTDGEQYRAVFTNTAGTVTSNAATVTLNNFAPYVGSQSAALTVDVGDVSTFSVVAISKPSPPAYQWQVSIGGGAYSNVSGATASSYSMTAAYADNGNSYRVVMTNSAGSGTSAARTLTVNAPPVAPTPVVTPTPVFIPTPVVVAPTYLEPVVVAPVASAVDPPVIYGAPTATLDRPTVTYGEVTVLTGTTKPDMLVSIYGATRPSTTYARIGQVRSGADGAYRFTKKLTANTRLYVAVARLPRSVIVAQNVRSSVTFTGAKVAANQYIFSGRVGPARAGQRVTIYYRTTGGGKAVFTRAFTDALGNYGAVRTVKASGHRRYTVFAHVDTDAVRLGNNSADMAIATYRAPR